jgi:hypothetical protein
MRKLAQFSGLFILLGLVSGCGATSDRLVKEQIGLLNELADAYESGAPQSRIDEIKQALDENDEKIKELKLPDEAKRRIKRDYDADVRKALKRIEEARKRAGIKEEDLPQYKH